MPLLTDQIPITVHTAWAHFFIERLRVTAASAGRYDGRLLRPSIPPQPNPREVQLAHELSSILYDWQAIVKGRIAVQCQIVDRIMRALRSARKDAASAKTSFQAHPLSRNGSAQRDIPPGLYLLAQSFLACSEAVFTYIVWRFMLVPELARIVISGVMGIFMPLLGHGVGRSLRTRRAMDPEQARESMNIATALVAVAIAYAFVAGQMLHIFIAKQLTTVSQAHHLVPPSSLLISSLYLVIFGISTGLSYYATYPDPDFEHLSDEFEANKAKEKYQQHAYDAEKAEFKGMCAMCQEQEQSLIEHGRSIMATYRHSYRLYHDPTLAPDGSASFVETPWTFEGQRINWPRQYQQQEEEDE